MKSHISRFRANLVVAIYFLMTICTVALAQTPTVTVRFANPSYDCVNDQYCVDVEFLADTTNVQVFGMNVRFFYDDDILELVSFSDFQGGYGPVSPDPPIITTNGPAGPALFNFTGPAEFINGAIQLLDTSNAIMLDTVIWTKLFQVCFTVDDTNPDVENFCPPIVWDLEQNPANGGFLTGDDGVVITVVDPNGESSPSIENVVQFNWEYIGPGTPPYGQPIEIECTSINCTGRLSVLKTDTLLIGDCLEPGDSILYNITVINEGIVTISNITVTDPGTTGLECIPAIPFSIDPGDTVSCTAVHIITQGDINAGTYSNIATAEGTNPDTVLVSDNSDDPADTTDIDPNADGNPDDPTVTPLPLPELSVLKTGILDLGANGTLEPGDQILYSITVTNTGNQLISNITLSDPNATGLNCFPATPFNLSPGNSASCNAFHMITQPDIDAGFYENSATATGENPDGDPVSDVSDDPSDTTDIDPNADCNPDDPTVTLLEPTPIIIVRFSNPDFNCLDEEYCVDVEFMSDTDSLELFGMNVRFFYDDDILELIDFRDFQGGYGPVSPDPPTVSTSAFAGPAFFNFGGPADFVNGAIQLTDNTQPPIYLSTTGWTKIFQVCFTIDDADADIDTFCPPIVWDLEVDPEDGGFLIGDDGVVITVVDPDSIQQSVPVTENVVQFNWQYSGPGTAPYGEPIELECTSINCFPMLICAADITIECDDSTSPDSTGFATSSDNCEGDSTITFSDSIILGSCPQSYTITRTWIVINECELSDTCIQMITVVDTTAPAIICPGDITIECDASTSPDNTGIASATDNCDTTVVVTSSDITIPGSCPQEYTIQRTWLATDSCGNSSTCLQTITIQDNTPPVITCPEDLTLACTDTIPADTATAIDNCGSVTYSYSDIMCENPVQGFTGIYDFTNWSIILPPEGGSVTPMGDSEVMLVSPDDITACDDASVFFQIVIPSTGQLVFDWNYLTNDSDGPSFDPFGYNLNGTFFQLTNDIGPDAQSGTTTVAVTAGDVFAFEQQSTDCIFGAGATTVVEFFACIEQAGEVCTELIIRTHTAADECGNESSCVQTIFIVDTIAPVITCPADITIECDDSTLPDNTGLATAIDNCDTLPTITFADVTLAGSCPQESTINRTWTATDACGNSSTCLQVIVVDDSTPPTITCPPNLTIECTDSTLPDSTGFATATDNCDTLPEITFSDVSVEGSCPQEYSITRTWVATDTCGNSSSCVQIIQVIDTLPPAITCPPDTIIECTASTLPDSTGFATATDLCDTLPEITFSDSITPGTCPQEYTITRTWVATDTCGNSSSCDQIISVVDTIPPAITCPDDITIECDASTSPDNTGLASATDNCDTLPLITSTDVTIAGSCPQEYTIQRTWNATDACGNSSTCLQTISVEDNTPPVITCPEDLTLACTDTIPADTAIATDNCSNLITYSYSDIMCENPVQGFTGIYDFSNWSIILPPEGGSVTPMGDSEVMLVSPDDITVCDDASVFFQIVIPSTGQLVFDWNYLTNDSDGPAFDPFGYNLNGTFFQLTNDNGADAQSGTATVAVTAGDVFAFEQQSTDCIFGAGATTVVEFFACIEQADEVCTALIIRTHTAADECGNESSCVQTIFVIDSIAPVITCPSDITIECGESTLPDSTGFATAIDNCDTLPIITFADVTVAGSCPQESTINRTWTATDDCGNSSTCLQVIVVDDSTPPVITCPADLTIECTDSSAPDSTGIATATDNCDPLPSITFADATVAGSCPQESTINRTWTATDACGNTSTCLQVIVVDDSTPPTITCPPNLTIECTDSTSPDSTGIAAATDNCDPLPSITFADLTVAGSCPQESTINRTWTATDACGNSSTCVQVIVVDDSTPPVITCPTNVTVECTASTAPAATGTATATDNCDAVPTVTFSDVTVGGSCPQERTITRTWLATDDCGNSSTCTQLIVVDDNLAPTITCPANVTIECTASTLPANTGNASATDNCDATPTITFGDVTVAGTCPQERTINRTWTATDDCGNSSTCLQVIFVDDSQAPSITCPANVTVSCANQVPPVNTASVTTSDNCGTVTVTHVGDVTTNMTCANRFTLTRTYRATDACGNSATCNQVITVFDNTPPSITCPPNITIDFGDDESPQSTGIPTTADNCVGTPLLSSIDVTIAGACDVQYTIQRTWTATDACGNTATCLQVIEVLGICCVLPDPVITGDGFVCPDEISVYSVVDFDPNNTYVWTLSGGGVILQDNDSNIVVQWQTLPGGPFTITLTEIYAPGCQTTTFFTVFIQGIETVTCNDLVQISLGPDCQAVVTPEMVLEGENEANNNYFVVITDQFGNVIPNATFTGEHVGQCFMVSVQNICNAQSCWGTICVEDKLPPIITCTDAIVPCGTPLDPVFSQPITGTVSQSVVSGLSIGPNAGTITSQPIELVLPSNALVTDVNVTIDLDHTWSGDILAELISPAGTSIILANAVCGSADNWENVTFDDQASTPVAVACNVTPPPALLQGFVIPEEALATFNNEFADGTWTLQLTDLANADGGTLNLVTLDVAYIESLPYAPEAIDSCGDVTLTFTETEEGDQCDTLTITRIWTATDESGNTATCVQVISVLPLDLDDVVFPENFIGECGDNVSPDFTGWPTLNGQQITDENALCNIFLGYWDKELAECGGGRKIVRTWTILDWCAVELIEGVQVIKLTDNEPPVLTCPPDFETGTDFWYCYANVSVPKPIAFDECSDIASYSLTSTAGVIIAFGDNYVINELPLGPHTLTWTVTDECGNSSTCSFQVTVIDNVVPVANCDLHTIVALTNDGPYGVTLVPASVFDDGSYDNCGPVTFRARRMDSCIDFDWTTEGACIDDVPGGIPPVNSRDRGTVHRPCVPFACCDVGAGPIMVELEVTDASGNVNYCMVEAEVQDKISPFVECPPDIIVSCDFWFNIEEGTFTDSEGNFDGSLDEDPLSAIFGNMYDAFRYDESVRENIIINDPGNTDLFQPHNWGLDGWADDNCEVNLQVRVRLIDDCTGGDLPGNAPQNAVKLIERRFSAMDGSGISPGTCTQRIWVVDFDPFYITDQTCNNENPQDGVIWPCDVVLSTCPDSVSDTGEPIVFDDACSLIGIAYEDTRFDFVDGACFKILRRWSVIDWCQYNPQTGDGIWHYTQVIKVHDGEGPDFVDCPVGPVTLCVADTGVTLPDNNQAFLGEDDPQATSCSVHLNLTQKVFETCSDVVLFDVKIYPYNGTDYWQVKQNGTAIVDDQNIAVLSFDTRESLIPFVRTDGIPYNSPYCGDYHRILWSAQDGCGNWSTCEYLFRLEDCKQPSPVCINGLSTVVMPIGGQVTIWAKDFNASSFDDCTPADELLYSFSGDAYEPSFTYTCENVPVFGVEITEEIWVADGGVDHNCNGVIEWSERNKDYCTTTIVITDNNDVCSGSGSILAGDIATDLPQSVEKVNVYLTSPGHFFPTYVTSTNGKYNFHNLAGGLDYTITPERKDDPKNGVSTLDLVRIQKHLLGKELFTSPYQYIAADANNSQQVSAIDLVEIRKLILGIYNEFPSNESWRFVDKGFILNPAHPWPIRERIEIADLALDSMMHNDFVAVKVGDVNHTVKANLTQIQPRDGRRIMKIHASVSGEAEPGKMIEMKLTFPEKVYGFQWTMESGGVEFASIQSEDITIDQQHVGLLRDGIVTMSWNEDVSAEESSDEPITLVIRWKVTGNVELNDIVRLTSLVTEAEAYATNEEIVDVRLVYDGDEDAPDFALYQNQPNPWNSQTTIGFDLPSDGNAVLTVFDVAGKEVLTVEGLYKAGYNVITLQSKDLPETGVMYYRLESGEYSASKKMVRIH